MPLIIFPFALNLMVGIIVWMSEILLAQKIFLTIVLAIKFTLFFVYAIVVESEMAKKIGLSTCAALNAFLL